MRETKAKRKLEAKEQLLQESRKRISINIGNQPIRKSPEVHPPAPQSSKAPDSPFQMRMKGSSSPVEDTIRQTLRFLPAVMSSDMKMSDIDGSMPTPFHHQNDYDNDNILPDAEDLSEPENIPHEGSDSLLPLLEHTPHAASRMLIESAKEKSLPSLSTAVVFKPISKVAKKAPGTDFPV